MHKFICKIREGIIVPLDSKKQKLFNKVLNSHEINENTVLITIEQSSKPVNVNQEKLYKAFILKASDYFGNQYFEMEALMIDYYPKDDDGTPIEVSRWKSYQLNQFIDKAMAVLGQHGFIWEQ